jgi:hypothetical protein
LLVWIQKVKLRSEDALQRIGMLELIPEEGVNLDAAVIVALYDVVFVPLELGQVLDGSADIAQTFSPRLGVLVDSFDCFHA